jgi:hypothetical protein
MSSGSLLLSLRYSSSIVAASSCASVKVGKSFLALALARSSSSSVGGGGASSQEAACAGAGPAGACARAVEGTAGAGAVEGAAGADAEAVRELFALMRELSHSGGSCWC